MAPVVGTAHSLCQARMPPPARGGPAQSPTRYRWAADNQQRLGCHSLALDRSEDLPHRLRRRTLDKGRHDRVLQEGALQDDRLLAVPATLGEPAPLTGRIDTWISHSAISRGGPAAPRAAGRRGATVEGPRCGWGSEL